MNYLGFARKYRPQTLDEVIGQKEIAATIRNSIESGRIHHAYLFCGPRGVGKTSMARILAKSLNCLKGISASPCGECEACLRIATGDYVDVVEIDGASNRGIDEIRELKENVQYRPTQARFKIIIIDEVHMLTTQAFNALLKTLEEPPTYIKFIFATTEIFQIPETILSRCQRFNFNKITLQDVINHLHIIANKEGLQIEDALLERVARRSSGALRDSLVLLDQLAAAVAKGEPIKEELLDQIAGSTSQDSQQIIEAIFQQDATSLLRLVRKFLYRGGNIGDLLNSIVQQFRDMLVSLYTNQNQDLIEGSESYQEWIIQQSKKSQPEFIQLALQLLLEASKSLRRGLVDSIILEVTLLKILHIDSLLSLKQMEEQLLGLEEKITQQIGAIPFKQPSMNHHPPARVESTRENIPPTSEKSPPLPPSTRENIPPTSEKSPPFPPSTRENIPPMSEKSPPLPPSTRENIPPMSEKSPPLPPSTRENIPPHPLLENPSPKIQTSVSISNTTSPGVPYREGLPHLQEEQSVNTDTDESYNLENDEITKEDDDHIASHLSSFHPPHPTNGGASPQPANASASAYTHFPSHNFSPSTNFLSELETAWNHILKMVEGSKMLHQVLSHSKYSLQKNCITITIPKTYEVMLQLIYQERDKIGSQFEKMLGKSVIIKVIADPNLIIAPPPTSPIVQKAMAVFNGEICE